MTKKAEPREMQEINNEYAQVCVKVGNTRYQLHVLEAEMAKYFEHMQSLNLEGSERAKLDAAKQEAEKAATNV